MSSKFPNLDAERLTGYGFCRISNTAKMLSRIDKPNWVDLLAHHLHRETTEMERAIRQSPSSMASWEDYYRRTLSESKITVDPEVYMLMPASGHTITGFRPRGIHFCNMDSVNKLNTERIRDAHCEDGINTSGEETKRMKVECENVLIETECIDSIEYGQCFREPDRNDVYMKMETCQVYVTIKKRQMLGVNTSKGVLLATGQIRLFPTEMRVVPVEARVLWKDK